MFANSSKAATLGTSNQLASKDQHGVHVAVGPDNEMFRAELRTKMGALENQARTIPDVSSGLRSSMR